ncbi:MAG: PrsW family intramembrane metalloprotease [Bacteroidales bacterium]|nr:PrsW family intramembrane metalloprotease [Bacteroidales bacterium]MDD4210684.1 PrsW family intramembrane metalloprotease [Bacteroidales bacterium]
MELTDIFIIVSAMAIGIVFLWAIRSYDFYEKEPFIKLLLMMFLGGILSVLLSTAAYYFVPVKYNIFDAIFKIGLIEEISKLLALMILYLIIKKNFNEIVDGIVYISAISLGFAVIENIFYCFQSDEPFLLLLHRSVFSVMGHISFSGYMGLAFYIHKKVHRNYTGLLLSIGLAALAHGFYDGFLFHYEVSDFFQFVFLALVILQLFLLRTVLGFSERRAFLNESLFQIRTNTLFGHCCHCKNDVKAKELSFGKIHCMQCPQCGYYIFDEENLARLLVYYCPANNYKRLLKNLPRYHNILLLDEAQKIRFNLNDKCLNAPIDELAQLLQACNRADRQRILEIPLIGPLFAFLGLRFMQDANKV